MNLLELCVLCVKSHYLVTNLVDYDGLPPSIQLPIHALQTPLHVQQPYMVQLGSQVVMFYALFHFPLLLSQMLEKNVSVKNKGRIN